MKDLDSKLLAAIRERDTAQTSILLQQGAGININTHYGFTLLAHMEYALKVNRIDQDKLQLAAEHVRQRQTNDSEQFEQQQLRQLAT